MELTYLVKKDNIYKNINEILSLEFKFSARLASKLIRNKKIYKNNFIVDTRDSIALGDTIIINLDLFEDNSNIIPLKMNLDILYEDEWFLVVNKPAGMAIHPSVTHYNNSLSNGIKYYFDLINLHKKIRPVNRLDFDTSGLVIFAKCEYIQEMFSRQMANGDFKKYYLCIVDGTLSKKSGIIDLPIARKKDSIIERCISVDGQTSITNYRVLKESHNISLLQCKLETGRTHQIRIHMQALGHPIIGDTLYGNKSSLINRQALHSYKIECIHPVTYKKIEFLSELPKDMQIL